MTTNYTVVAKKQKAFWSTNPDEYVTLYVLAHNAETALAAAKALLPEQGDDYELRIKEVTMNFPNNEENDDV